MLHTQITTDRGLTRRQILGAGVSGLALALSGCAGMTSSGSDTVITETSTEGTELTVPLSSEASVTEVALLNDGETARRTNVAAGETTATIDLLEDSDEWSGLNVIDAGSYNLAAISDGDVVEQQEVTFEPEWTLLETELHGVDSGSTAGIEFAITIENTGTTPLNLIRFGFVEGVPNPTPRDTDRRDWKFERLNPGSMPGKRRPIIGVGNTVSFATSSSPFSYHERSQHSPESWKDPEGRCGGSVHDATLVIDPDPAEARENSVSIAYHGDILTGRIGDNWACESASVEEAPETDTDTA